MKTVLAADPRFQAVWGTFRRAGLHRSYAARREHYASAAADRGLVYSPEATAEAVRERLGARGFTPARRSPGEVHTFAFLPSVGWHDLLLNDLRELGPVTVFDYTALGYSADDFYPPQRGSASLRSSMNQELLPALRKAHAVRPVDWVFVYASGGELGTGLVSRIIEELGIPVVSMFLDDKHGWEGTPSGAQRSGQVDIVKEFDLSWTSARVACEWYMVEGARPLYMPEGFDVATYHPLQLDKDIPASFLGSAYGYRARLIGYLRSHGVDVRTYGSGWPGSEWVQDVAEIPNRSIINIGMGGIGYSPSLTNLKARDFEIPGTGGGVYITSYNADLAQHFILGEEILCYGSPDELLELVRYYLARPEEATGIAERGMQRCLREHRWLHRYQKICGILGILPDPENNHNVGNSR
jgi:hypothetical protein